MNVQQKISVDLAEAAEALRNRGKPLATARAGELRLALHPSDADLWLTIARDERGGLALRIPLFVEGSEVTVTEDDGALPEVTAVNETGRFEIGLEAPTDGLDLLHWNVEFTPAKTIHLPYLPRDLIVYGPGGDPAKTSGQIEAAQRRINTGLCYFHCKAPDLGKVLYVQNLTALNPYFAATGTKPESAVGGQWPELGYLPPTQPGNPNSALPAGRPVTLSAGRLAIRNNPEASEADGAWQFLDMLASLYPALDKPQTERRDWIKRSEKTLRDLSSARKARLQVYGNTYFHPYTAAEYPDSMVQLSLLSAISDWSRWTGKRHPLEAQIRKGFSRFFDPKLGAIRRYLPNVGDDKDGDAVDSWYPLHTLLNLSNLALNGEDWARELFVKAIGQTIEAARHFEYLWPIQYKITDFTVITAIAGADNRGQTDVGGIYAWVMLQAFQLTGEPLYLNEARAAIDAAKGMRFDLNYQANLTAWGAAACIRLWRISGDKSYLTQSYVYLASFFHNAQMWESEIGTARHFTNFLGVMCLQDAPYMAEYECFDSYAAFERFLDYGGPDLIGSARMLVTEYCRFALHRAWFYYPDALPRDALAPKQRNGEIDRELSFPLEDLYPDGQPAGQVGQEIYGAGAAMIFATRAYHRVGGAPFVLFCDHFMRALTRIDGNTVSFRIEGELPNCAELRVVRKGRKKFSQIGLTGPDGKPIAPRLRDEKEWCFDLLPCGTFVLSW